MKISLTSIHSLFCHATMEAATRSARATDYEAAGILLRTWTIASDMGADEAAKEWKVLRGLISDADRDATITATKIDTSTLIRRIPCRCDRCGRPSSFGDLDDAMTCTPCQIEEGR